MGGKGRPEQLIISEGRAAALSTMAHTEQSIVHHKCTVYAELAMADLVLKSHY